MEQLLKIIETEFDRTVAGQVGIPTRAAFLSRIAGYLKAWQDPYSEKCPYCQSVHIEPADPWNNTKCLNCGATEIGIHDQNCPATEEELKVGWLKATK